MPGPSGGVRRRLLLGLAVVAVLLIGAWWTWLRPPRWYRAASETAPRSMETATAVENAVTTEVTRVRGIAPWGFIVSQDQVNAWLATRLPEWEASRSDFTMPEEILDPRVRLDGGRVEIAAILPAATLPVFVSVTVSPRVEGDDLVLELVDSSVVGGGLGDQLIELVDGWIDGVDGLGWDAEARGWRIPAAWRLGDGRRVVLEDLEVLPGELGLQFRTESPRPRP